MNREKVKLAVLWSSVEALSSVIINFGALIYLARILKPEDFGNLASAQIIASLLSLILGLGLTEAVIQRKEIDAKVLEVVLGFCFLLCLVAIIIASGVILFFVFFLNNPTVAKILIFETCGVIFTLLSILPTALLMRELKMSAFTKRTLVSKLFFFVTAIPLALSGFGFWSVVFGNLMQYFSAALLLFISVRKVLPRRVRLDFEILKELLTFGIFVMMENVLWSVLSRVFSLLIAAFHGTYALGIYNMSTRLTDAILNVLNTIVGRLVLPLFSRLQDDHKQLEKAFFKATQFFNLISMPAFIGLALTCYDWIPLILGAQWIKIAPIIQIISIMNAVMFSRMFVGTTMKAIGQSKRFMYLSAVSAALSIITVFITKDTSLVTTMLSWTSVRIMVTIPFGMYLMYKIIKITSLNQLKPVFLPCFATIIMVLFFEPINSLLRHHSIEGIALLVLEVVSSILVYLISIFIFVKFRMLRVY
ncbi:oligosaccharide flippase family protein [Raoultella terrigena]|uniref:oligosaccharide flippase family protein n=1 Tax=Raoultella terrigena TaxID=577 RepID=UPI0013309A92|nr:oligosaccharide flippase family protein [Raoultella terrigena]